jgi:hypothetical protein
MEAIRSMKLGFICINFPGNLNPMGLQIGY